MIIVYSLSSWYANLIDLFLSGKCMDMYGIGWYMGATENKLAKRKTDVVE